MDVFDGIIDIFYLELGVLDIDDKLLFLMNDHIEFILYDVGEKGLVMLVLD
jgi:hypothetical protein